MTDRRAGAAVARVMVAMAIVGLSGCGGAQVPERSVSPSASSVHSGQPAPFAEGPLAALQMLPADVEDVAYTDWAGIRAAAGLDGSGALVRDALFVELLGLHSAESWFAGPQRLSHHEAWGFDGADADWELTATLPGGSLVHVLALGAETDWDALIGRFEERGYTAEAHGGAVLRSAERDLFIDWQAASDSAMLNAATIDEMRLIVMADEMADVTHVVDSVTAAESSLDAVEAVPGAVTRLAGTLSGSLHIGGDRCVDAGFTPLLPPDVAAEYLSGLFRYEVLGGGYLVDGERARVRAVLTFSDPGAAHEDLPARAAMARSWGEVSGLFILAAADVVEASVVLELGVDGGPGPALEDLRVGGGYTGCL